MIRVDGSKLLLRHTTPHLVNPAAQTEVDELIADHPCGFCVGRAVRAVELFFAKVWQGRSVLLPSLPHCPIFVRSARSLGESLSARLHLISHTVEILGPSIDQPRDSDGRSGGRVWRSRVVGIDLPSLDFLRLAVKQLRYGRELEGVILFKKPGYEGARLRFPNGSEVCNAQQCTIDLPSEWASREP